MKCPFRRLSLLLLAAALLFGAGAAAVGKKHK